MPPATVVKARKGKGQHLGKTNRRILILMAIPCIALLLAFEYLPIFGWAYAFFRFQPGTALFNSEFVGFANFTKIFTGHNLEELLTVMRNTLVFSFLGFLLTPIPMIFAIVMSELKHLRFQRVIQVTTTFPNFVSMIIIYAICMALFSVSDGVVNNLLINTGILGERHNFLADENIVFGFQTSIGLWRTLGFSAIIYYAAISGVDTELYDAAAVDGANFVQRMWYIKVPGCLPTYLVLLLLAIGNMLNNGFEQYFVFHNAAVHDKIQVLDLFIYRVGMGRGNYSLATAIGIQKTFISVILLFSANFIAKRFAGRSIL